MSDENIITTPAADAPTSIINDDGSFVENWYEKYGEENIAHLSRYKTFDDLVNSTVATKKKFGKDPNSLIEIPTEHSSDEVKAAFRKAKGAPDSIDAYEYKLSDEMAVKLGPVDDAKMAAFKEFAHKQEWSPKQFKDALDFYHSNLAADIDTNEAEFNKQRSAAAEAGKAELRKRDGWRTEEEYKAKVQRAQSVMEKYGGIDAVADLNLQNSPEMLIFLDNIAESMSEDTLKGLKGSTVAAVANVKIKISENRSKMNDIMKKDPVNYRNDPEFRELDKSNTELYKQYPTK